MVGAGCVVAFAFAALTAIVLFLAAKNRGDADARMRAARLHSALGRLRWRPGDQSALKEISSAVGDGRWMLGPTAHTQFDLWNRAVDFAFANIGTDDGKEVLQRFVVPLSCNSNLDLGRFLRKAVEAVQENADRRDIHRALQGVLQSIPRIALNQSEWLYQEILKMVRKAPHNPDLAVLALEVGRWHCSRTRPDKRVTVYDEQMIQNDIAVRRAGS